MEVTVVVFRDGSGVTEPDAFGERHDAIDYLEMELGYTRDSEDPTRWYNGRLTADLYTVQVKGEK